MTANIYHPQFWTGQDYWDYTNQTPGNSGVWNGFAYKMNNKTTNEADFIVIHQDIDHSMKLRARAGCFCLVTGEEKSIHENYHQEYLDQFDLIITSRDDIQHPNVIRCHYLHPWWIKKTYDELSAMACPTKVRNLSAIISTLTATAGHKKRFGFINQLKGHYKDELDWFSKGQSTYLADKWDGLAPYRYSIVAENSYYPNYFTEKISDSFLAFTMPLYSGCPNISDFFDERSFVKIDINSFMNSISIIDETIRGDLFEQNKSYIRESRDLVLNKYQFLAALTHILEKVETPETKISKTLKPHRYFNDNRLKRVLKASVKKMVGRKP